MSLQILTLPLAYGPLRHVCYKSVCGGWDPTVGCFNLFSQRVANSPLTMRCHSSRNHFEGFLSGLSRNEKLQDCITLWTSLNTQRLLYLPPFLTLKISTFCPHSVLLCYVWVWEQTTIISLYSIKWLVFINETESVYCAVQTGFGCNEC
jgi:hypothetical protein